MFKRLTDFGYQRTTKEAFGFYIAYLVLLMLVGSLIGGVVGAFVPEAAYENGFKIGTLASVIISVLLSYYILQQKKQDTDFRFIILTVSAGVLALFGGSLFGLIIPAYLSTQKAKGAASSKPKTVAKKVVSSAKSVRKRKA